eukprot:5746239-Amphidinium_carterae.1
MKPVSVARRMECLGLNGMLRMTSRYQLESAYRTKTQVGRAGPGTLTLSQPSSRMFTNAVH